MPVLILAVIMTMMGVIASVVIFVAWQSVPAARWFAAALMLLFGGLIVGARLHMRAARADITEGVAQIRTGRATKKRTGGNRVTWYYATVETIGEVEVTRAQYDAMAIDSVYTVSFSPRVRRAWTVERV